MQWSQLQQRHRPPDLQTRSGWSGPLRQRKPLTQLQLRLLKCHRKRALDTARTQYFTHQELTGCCWNKHQTLYYIVLHILIDIPSPFTIGLTPLQTKKWTLSLRKSCCANLFFYYYYKGLRQQFFLKRPSNAVYVKLLLLSQQLPTALFTELLIFCRYVLFFLKNQYLLLRIFCVVLLIPFEEVLNLQSVPNTELRPVCGINLQEIRLAFELGLYSSRVPIR